MNKDRVDELKQNLESDVYKNMDALERLREDTLTSTEKLVDILDGYMSKLDDFEIEEEITTMEVVSNDAVELEVNDEDMLREYNEKIHDFSLETLTELLAKGEVEKEQKATEEMDFEDRDIDTIIDEIDDYKTAELTNTDQLDITNVDTVSIDESEAKSEYTQSFTAPKEEQIEDFDIEIEATDTEVETNLTDSTDAKKTKDKKSKQKVKKEKTTKKPKAKKKPKTGKKQKTDKDDKNIIDIILSVIIVLLFMLIAFNVLTMI